MELTIDEAPKQAVAAHKEGNIEEAEKLYQAVLGVQPQHPDANHNLGVLAVGLKKVQSALPYLRNALDSNPQIGQFWLSYVDALTKLGQVSNARIAVSEAKKRGISDKHLEQLEMVLDAYRFDY